MKWTSTVLCIALVPVDKPWLWLKAKIYQQSTESKQAEASRKLIDLHILLIGSEEGHTPDQETTKKAEKQMHLFSILHSESLDYV